MLLFLYIDAINSIYFIHTESDIVKYYLARVSDWTNNVFLQSFASSLSNALVSRKKSQYV